MKRIVFAFFSFITSFLSLFAADYPNPDHVIYLWHDIAAPSSNGLPTGGERDYGTHCSGVTDPELWVYLPSHPTGVAVLACPGGGYYDVWYNHEGAQMAEWYQAHGVVYAVLKYRLPNGHKEVPLDDVHRAMHLLRAHSLDWHIERLGIQGCSAGGHLASTAATHYQTAEERPDFQILFYPVVTLDPAHTHQGTLDNLLGKNPSRALIRAYSNELQVTADTPPALLLASSDDDVVPVCNSVDYYNALIAHGVPATMHLFPTGGHGWCWKDTFPYKHIYQAALARFLQSMVGQRRLLFIGDSITDGAWGNSGGTDKPSSERSEWDKNHVYGHGYVEQCCAYFERHYPDWGIKCWNRGISGHTLADVERRWHDDALILRPTTISLLIGTNDVNAYLDAYQKDSTLQFDVTDFETRLRRLVQQTRDSLPHVQWVLCTPFTAKAGWAGAAATFPLRERLIGKVAAAIRRVAEDEHATLVDFHALIARLYTQYPTTDPAYWVWDGLHPTPAAHCAMAEYWRETAASAVLPTAFLAK